MARADSTTDEIPTRATSSGGPRLRRLWFGLFGGAAAWSVQLLVNYSLIAHACYPARAPVATPVVPGARVIALVVSLAALACAVAALWAAHDAWQSTRPAAAVSREPRPIGERRSRFMAFAGLITSAAFVFAVLMSTIPLLVGPLCAGAT